MVSLIETIIYSISEGYIIVEGSFITFLNALILWHSW